MKHHPKKKSVVATVLFIGIFLLVPMSFGQITGHSLSSQPLLLNNNTCSNDTGWCGYHVLNSTPEAWGTDRPKVALDEDGNGMAVWHQDVGGFSQIFSETFDRNAKSWAVTNVQVNEDSTAQSSYPEISMNSSGNAMVVWQQYDGAVYNIMAKFYNKETATWESATAIDSSSNSATGPKIGLADDGKAVAIWTQKSGSTYSLYGNTYDPSSGWGTAAALETSSGQLNSGTDFYSLGMGPNGHAVALFIQNTSSDSSEKNAYANYYNPDHGWSGSTLIETVEDQVRNESVSVSVDASGNAVAAWVHIIDSVYSIYSNYYKAGTGWQTAQKINSDTSSDGASTAHIRTAIDLNGNAVVVWDQDDNAESLGDPSRILWANRYDATHAAWDGTANLDNHFNEYGAESEPVVGMDKHGNAYVVYSKQNAMGMVKYDASSSSWEASSRISTDGLASGLQRTHIAVNADGEIMFAGHKYSDSFENLYVNVYLKRKITDRGDVITNPASFINNKVIR